jgi:hypothetical protein
LAVAREKLEEVNLALARSEEQLEQSKERELRQSQELLRLSLTAQSNLNET